jgi:hypothetical protein
VADVPLLGEYALYNLAALDLVRELNLPQIREQAME